MKKLVVGVLLVGMLVGFAPSVHAMEAPTDLVLRQQLITLITQLIKVLQAQLDVMLAQEALQTPITQVPIIPIENPTSTPVLESLAFTETPKIVWKKVSYENNSITFTESKPSYITWQTNRPSKLLVSPILPDETGWTTSQGAWGSCGRANLSREINSICKIKVIDEFGNTLEYSLEVFKDSIDL